LNIIKNWFRKIALNILTEIQIKNEINLVGQFDKSKINILYVKTGNLPKGRADEWCNKVHENIKKLDSNIKLIIIPYSSLSFLIGPIYQLEENELNVIYIPTHRMPRGKAEEYIKSILKKLNNLKDDKTKYKSILIALESN
jgi:U3 small nucleolar ribonucleoprotein component